MSHYSVSVISNSPDDVEYMLEPYCENIEVPVYISETKAEFIKNRRHRLMEGCYKDFLKNPVLYRLQHRDNPEHLNYIENVVPQLLLMSDEDFYHHEIVPYLKDGVVDKDGNIISTYNPDSKWDWYEIGGRWSGMLLIKTSVLKEAGYKQVQTNTEPPPGYCWVNQAKVKHIEWDKMRELKLKALIPYDEFIAENRFYNPEYLKRKYPKEKYEKIQTEFSTFAILNKDGWTEPGEMGWFGCSSAAPEKECEWNYSFFDKFIKNEDSEKFITIIDCHI